MSPKLIKHLRKTIKRKWPHLITKYMIYGFRVFPNSTPGTSQLCSFDFNRDTRNLEKLYVIARLFHCLDTSFELIVDIYYPKSIIQIENNIINFVEIAIKLHKDWNR